MVTGGDPVPRSSDSGGGGGFLRFALFSSVAGSGCAETCELCGWAVTAGEGGAAAALAAGAGLD